MPSIQLFADLISRVNVGLIRKKKYVICLNSNFCKLNLNKLFELGYFTFFTVLDFKYLRLGLKFVFKKSAIRCWIGFYLYKKYIYAKLSVIKKKLFSNYAFKNGFLLYTTSKGGVLTDVECFLYRVGGKLVSFIN